MRLFLLPMDSEHRSFSYDTCCLNLVILLVIWIPYLYEGIVCIFSVAVWKLALPNIVCYLLLTTTYLHYYELSFNLYLFLYIFLLHIVF